MGTVFTLPKGLDIQMDSSGYCTVVRTATSSASTPTALTVEDRQDPVSAPLDVSTEAVKARIERTIDDLVAGRTTPKQRRGLGSAVERADRVKPSSDAGIGRAIGAGPKGVGFS